MNHKIEVIAKDNFRSFKKDYKVVFDYENTNVIFLMGINGCGKSTIIKAIRGTLNSNSDAQKKWGAKYDVEMITPMFDVNIEGFDKIYHLDMDGLDNGSSFLNAADASAFIDFGGFATQNVSAGEKTMMTIAKLKKDVEDAENTLIILDELDNHLDFGFRNRFVPWINKIFPKSKKLIITHDILMATISEGDVMMIEAIRSKETNYKCETLLSEPVKYENKLKHILFEVTTLHTLKKLNNNKNKETNDNGEKESN